MKRKQSKEFKLIFFEFDMFYLAYQSIKDKLYAGDKSCLDLFFHNSILETWITHFRNLYAFLYHENGYSEDILAYKLFRDPSHWLKYKPRPTEMIEGFYKKAIKRSSNISYSKMRVIEDWNMLDASTEIISAFDDFIRLISREVHIDPDWTYGRISWFKKIIDDLNNLKGNGVKMNQKSMDHVKNAETYFPESFSLLKSNVSNVIRQWNTII